MKKGIHPTWHHDCVVTCSCGNSFTISSNTSTLQVDICSNCHPFFTGEVKFVDRQGRVDAFKKKVQQAQSTQTKKKKKQKKQDDGAHQSYKDILRSKKTPGKKAPKKSAKAAPKSESANEAAAPAA